MPILEVARFLGQSAVTISLSASSMVCSVILIYRQPVTWGAAAIPFLFTFVVYNFDRLVDLDFWANPERSRALRSSRTLLAVIMATCLVGVLVLASFHGWQTLFMVLAFPIASAAYVLPVLPLRRFRRLKEIPYLKSFYVPATWCILVPLALNLCGADWNDGPWLFVLSFYYLRIFIGASLADVRDIRSDIAAGVPTLAVRTGETATYRLLTVLNYLSVALPVMALTMGKSPALLALIPSCLLTMGIIWAFRRFPRHREVLCDVLDFEYISYFPLLLLAFWLLGV